MNVGDEDASMAIIPALNNEVLVQVDIGRIDPLRMKWPL